MFFHFIKYVKKIIYKKIVGYSKYNSSAQDNGSTIQTQINCIEEYCLINGYVLVKHYFDLALFDRKRDIENNFWR